jgi:hypothetical protein
MLCATKDNLLSSYNNAVQEWAAAAMKLTQVSGARSPEFDRLQEQNRAARQRAEAARNDYLMHIADHGCRDEPVTRKGGGAPRKDADPAGFRLQLASLRDKSVEGRNLAL